MNELTVERLVEVLQAVPQQCLDMHNGPGPFTHRDCLMFPDHEAMGEAVYALIVADRARGEDVWQQAAGMETPSGLATRLKDLEDNARRQLSRAERLGLELNGERTERKRLEAIVEEKHLHLDHAQARLATIERETVERAARVVWERGCRQLNAEAAWENEQTYAAIRALLPPGAADGGG